MIKGQKYKIAVVGTGCVGLSLVVLLAQNNKVTAADILPEKAEKISQRISPVQDQEIGEYLRDRVLEQEMDFFIFRYHMGVTGWLILMIRLSVISKFR